MLGGKGCRTHMDKHVSQNVSKYRHVSRVAVSHIHQYSLLNHPSLFGYCILIILIHAQDGARPACDLHMPLQLSFYFFGIFHVSLDLRKVASNNPIKHGLRQPVFLHHNRQPSSQHSKCFQNLAALVQPRNPVGRVKRILIMMFDFYSYSAPHGVPGTANFGGPSWAQELSRHQTCRHP